MSGAHNLHNMKIKITLKDPDGVYESIKEAAETSVSAVDGLSKKEREELAETRAEQIKEDCGKWVEWGEYVTIEIDTEAGTATVCPVK